MKVNFLFAFCFVLNVCLAQPKTTSYFDKTSVSISETNNSYQMIAEFNEAKTKKVQAYMDDHIKSSGFSFKNTQTDVMITLDDKMTFYMKASPGKLTLKFDKRKNSAEFYNRFKKMCEGIKDGRR